MSFFSFDEAKSDWNVRERGLAFTLAEEFDWSTAMAQEDIRQDYGERRYRALGFIGKRLHVLVFTPRGSQLHIISLRKANPREVNRYEEKNQS